MLETRRNERLRETVRGFRWNWGSLGFNVRECVFWITEIEPNPFITEKYVHEGDYNRMYAGRVACIWELADSVSKVHHINIVYLNMITKLNSFTLKSFSNYTNPNHLHFRAKNILFGYNGKGKSSVAVGIQKEFLKDATKKPENLRIFDRDYISKSLLLENSEDKIKGVEASFGKGGVDIEIKI